MNAKQVTDFVLSAIDGNISNIELYIKDVLARKFISINSENEANKLYAYSSYFLSQLSYDEQLDIRTYSGYNFKNINAILRNNWDYEKNGLLSEEIRQRYLEMAKRIKSTFLKNKALGFDLFAYRGVNIDVFNSFGVSSVNDLSKLKGKYFYELGFTSTSVIKNHSFFGSNDGWGTNYNVEIEYLIPSETDDGILLDSENLSYSKSQYEYLIESGSLSKILDVDIDSDNKKAYIKMMLIPEKVWNPIDYYNAHKKENSI